MGYALDMETIKYFSLFSGIGGFELGIYRSCTKNMATKDESRCNKETWQEIGETNRQSCELSDGSADRLTCIGFSEIDKYATQVYKTHFNHKEYGDVSTINWSDTEGFDFLVGGFPCQAFSIAGKRRGFDDTRGTLFFEIARCLWEKQPRLLLLENVKGLLSHDKGKTVGIILNTLDELGYDLQWQVLNSKNLGVPQNRERVFIVGHLRGTRRPEVFPIGKSCQGNLRHIQGKSNSQSQRIYSTSGISPTLAVSAGGGSGKTGRYVVPVQHSYGIRRLTPVECERLQGFPDGWTKGISDTQRYKCLGNAVTVNVIEAIVARLIL